MKHAENNTQMEIRPVGPHAARTSTAAVVNGPSCPAAFASWWSEYQAKVMKAFGSQESVFILEGRP
jgi:hypothetical protein